MDEFVGQRACARPISARKGLTYHQSAPATYAAQAAPASGLAYAVNQHSQVG